MVCAMSCCAERGGVSRPSVNACSTVGTPACVSSLGQRDGVILVRMHAAGRQQAHQMAGAAGLPQPGDQVAHRGSAFDLAAGERLADARQILQHHAAGADVEVPDFGIAHLPGRQADIGSRRAQQAHAGSRPQAVEHRRVREADGVVGGFVAPAKTVQHDQHHGAVLLHSRFLFDPFGVTLLEQPEPDQPERADDDAPPGEQREAMARHVVEE